MGVNGLSKVAHTKFTNMQIHMPSHALVKLNSSLISAYPGIKLATFFLNIYLRIAHRTIVPQGASPTKYIIDGIS